MTLQALVRHGPVSLKNRCYGRLEVPAPLSYAQIQACASDLKSLARMRFEDDLRIPLEIYSSPSLRCQSLAVALEGAWQDLGAPCAGIQWERDLLEMDFGLWEGLCWDYVPRLDLDTWAEDPWNFQPPGGESALDVWKRTQALQKRIQGRAFVALVTHGGVMRLWKSQPGQAMVSAPGFLEWMLA
jgi:alpha-ribazole phosphatase